jgi:hypothetical protein
MKKQLVIAVIDADSKVLVRLDVLPGIEWGYENDAGEVLWMGSVK